MTSKLFAACTIAFGLLAFGASAQTPEETLLTVTHGDTVTTYDQAGLEALGTTTIETTTIWTEGKQTFTGVPLAALVEAQGATDGIMLASAINDYTVEIPLSDAVANGPIVAFLNNGEPMSVRDKGPLWIVYPYDANPDYQSEVTYTRSIWQLDRIEIKD